MIKLEKNTAINLDAKSSASVKSLYIDPKISAEKFAREAAERRKQKNKEIEERAHAEFLKRRDEIREIRKQMIHEYTNLLPLILKQSNFNKDACADYTDLQGRKIAIIYIGIDKKHLKGIELGRYANLRLQKDIAIQFEGCEDFE